MTADVMTTAYGADAEVGDVILIDGNAKAIARRDGREFEATWFTAWFEDGSSRPIYKLARYAYVDPSGVVAARAKAISARSW